jgi:hypothetical protein
MSKPRFKILVGVTLGLLALVLCGSALRAEPPFSEVILESYSSPTGPVYWEGPAIIWIDGDKYLGTIVYSGEGEINNNSWHGTEVKVYSFPGLGLLEVSGTAKTVFAYVSPEHRWHRYSSHVQITYGEGVFEKARGTFNFVGYTDWDLTFANPPLAFEGTRAKVRGIQLP